MAKAKKAKKSAARKSSPKKAAAGKAPEKLAESSATSRLPSANVVKSLANVMINGKSKIDDIASDNSSAMRDAVDKRGVHAGAFKDALKGYRKAKKDAKSAAVYFQHRDHYEEVLGIDRLLSEQPELPIEADADAKANGGKAVAGAVKKAERSQPAMPDVTYPVDDKTRVRPNFTPPEAEQHLADQVGGKLN